MTTSRTGTAKYLRNSRRVKRQAQADGLTHCPGVTDTGCPYRHELDYNTPQLPNSAESDHITEHRDGAYANCHLGAGSWLYVGWNADGRAYVSVWSDTACEFGEAPGQEAAADPAEFEKLVETLLTTYV